LDWFEECYRDGSARSLRILLDSRSPRQDDVLPGSIALLANQHMGTDLECRGSQLYVGNLCFAQIAEPVRVAASAGGGAPNKKALRCVEVAHTGGMQTPVVRPGVVIIKTLASLL
jgi:hypothetical protein